MCVDEYIFIEDNIYEIYTASVKNCLTMINFDTNSCAICVPGC